MTVTIWQCLDCDWIIAIRERAAREYHDVAAAAVDLHRRHIGHDVESVTLLIDAGIVSKG